MIFEFKKDRSSISDIIYQAQFIMIGIIFGYWIWNPFAFNNFWSLFLTALMSFVLTVRFDISKNKSVKMT